jgi:hypothetical protein
MQVSRPMKGKIHRARNDAVITIICDGCKKKMLGKTGRRSFGRAWIFENTPNPDPIKGPLSIFVDACSRECFPKALDELAKKGTKGTSYNLHVTFDTTDPKEVLESFARQLRAIRWPTHARRGSSCACSFRK